MYPFYVHHSLRSSTLRAEERMLQLAQTLNWTLRRNIQTKRRMVQFSTPAIAPLSPRVRLVRALDSYVSLKEVWLDSCAESGKDEHAPWALFHEIAGNKVRSWL
jgi:phosphatidylinositol kinase/protein kinase (PI-3  family)